MLVRDPGRADRLQRTASTVGVTLQLARLDPTAGGLGADLVISTLPAGAADGLAGGDWRPGQTLLDVVYVPWPTAVARGASAAGATVCSGALMLLHQAAAQVELMTGRAAPLAGMRTALAAVAPGAGL